MILAWPSFSKIEKYALLIWLTLLVSLVIYVIDTTQILVSTNYYYVARQWLSEQNIYDGSGWYFTHMPQAAVLYLPFAIFPPQFSEVLWRVFLVLLFSSGLWSFKNLIQFSGKWFYLALTLICGIIFAYNSFMQGQLTIAVVAFLLFAIVAIVQGKWWVASIALMFSVAFMPSIIIFCLLLLILYRPLRLKMLLMSASMLALPFLFASPGYVLTQYQNDYYHFYALLQVAPIEGWANLFSVFNLLTGLQCSVPVIYGLRIFFALLIVRLGLYYKRRYSPLLAIVLIYTFAISYLLLLNQHTQTHDYLILMPMLVWFAFYFYKQKSDRSQAWQFTVLLVYIVLMCVNDPLYRLLQISLNWLPPMVTVFFILSLLWRLRKLPLPLEGAARSD